MTTKLLLKKLHLEEKEFITSSELRRYCKTFKLDYSRIIRYFISRGYLVRIFRGIFYIKGLDEMKLDKVKYSHLELVSKGLELKSVKNWYFGLYTALKMNNMTHEYFAVDYVVNDKIFRAKPIEIAGHKFKFMKFKPGLMGFGIIKNGLRYSDPEKTILDLIYAWRYSGIPEEKILMDISEYAVNMSKNKIKNYAKNYPKAILKMVEIL